MSPLLDTLLRFKTGHLQPLLLYPLELVVGLLSSTSRLSLICKQGSLAESSRRVSDLLFGLVCLLYEVQILRESSPGNEIYPLRSHRRIGISVWRIYMAEIHWEDHLTKFTVIIRQLRFLRIRIE